MKVPLSGDHHPTAHATPHCYDMGWSALERVEWANWSQLWSADGAGILAELRLAETKAGSGQSGEQSNADDTRAPTSLVFAWNASVSATSKT